MEDIDRNGYFVQRRKMYIGLPLHNMRSKLKFDWQGSDLSVQDQVGLRYKRKQENQAIKKMYTDRLDQRIHRKNHYPPYRLPTRCILPRTATRIHLLGNSNTSIPPKWPPLPSRTTLRKNWQTPLLLYCSPDPISITTPMNESSTPTASPNSPLLGHEDSPSMSRSPTSNLTAARPPIATTDPTTPTPRTTTPSLPPPSLPRPSLPRPSPIATAPSSPT